jgi:hypothetical protein
LAIKYVTWQAGGNSGFLFRMQQVLFYFSYLLLTPYQGTDEMIRNSIIIPGACLTVAMGGVQGTL